MWPWRVHLKEMPTCAIPSKMHFPHTDPFFKMPYVLAAVGLTAAAFFVVQAKYCRTRKTAARTTTATDETTTANTSSTTVSALTAPLHTPDDSSDDEEKAGDHTSSHSGGAGAQQQHQHQQTAMARNEVEMTDVLWFAHRGSSCFVLHALDELPLQLPANLFPNRVLLVQLFARFEQREARQEVVEP